MEKAMLRFTVAKLEELLNDVQMLLIELGALLDTIKSLALKENKDNSDQIEEAFDKLIDSLNDFMSDKHE